MRTLKVVITHLLFCPAMNVLFLLFVKIHGFTRITIGQITFWGDNGFLELITEATEYLRTLDEDLHEEFTTGRKMRFYSSRKRSEQVIIFGQFNINDGFCQMGVQGVVARIVYAHFVSKAIGGQFFSKAERHRASKLYSEAESQTRLWLEEKKFSAAVIEVFCRGK